MVKTVITDKGKTEVLRLAFATTGGFNFMALGGNGSNGSQNGNFKEITDTSYHRQEITVEEANDKSIKLSAIFDETNYSVSDGELITEIGLVNSYDIKQEETFFAYCEVPNIQKNDSISLKYTIIVEIE